MVIAGAASRIQPRSRPCELQLPLRNMFVESRARPLNAGRAMELGVGTKPPEISEDMGLNNEKDIFCGSAGRRNGYDCDSERRAAHYSSTGERRASLDRILRGRHQRRRMEQGHCKRQHCQRSQRGFHNWGYSWPELDRPKSPPRMRSSVANLAIISSGTCGWSVSKLIFLIGMSTRQRPRREILS